ncbi:hypothetical protein PIIN_01620 [Serendipita indica DSM 11827]|uniref:Uncharacterized protein n=1 Tax=Serendipita indica (strain DSM 11827) TaxID=1109443 RepID=G4T903_SERID|nr:hypothetical protein PIIN_01620 [Serendipita indica DSM 11827]
MATQQTRTPSSETLPAIRPASPLGTLRQSSKSMHESMVLPPIQSLTREFPSRLEHAHSEPNLGQRNSPPDPNGYHRKRTATGEVTSNLSPPSASKRRRLESTESNGASAELTAISAPGPSRSPSVRHGHSRQASGVDSHHLTPPTPPNNATLPSRGPGPSHEHRRTTSTSGMYAAPHAHDAPLKQEQISPPAVVVQSPATPSTLPSASSNSAAWQNESASFSRRISNASSSNLRPTGRKQPPSRLNFQPHHGHKSSLEANIAPSIRSAPPVPVPQGQMIPPRPAQPAGGSWISSRATSSSQLRSSHPGGVDTPELTPRANKNSEAWPSIPTPTSLRLSHSIIPPPVPPSNPNLTGARSPSARLPITPAVPSPIPTLGASTGSVADKARFMAKMSEIYDRTNVHKQCISAEDIDRRIKDVLVSRDLEIVQLKKEVAELRKLLRGPVPAAGGVSATVDQDGDVAMAHHLQPNNAREASAEEPASRAMTVSPSPQPGEARKDGAIGQIPEEVAQPLAAPTTPATLANGKPLAGTADAETTMATADAGAAAAKE